MKRLFAFLAILLAIGFSSCQCSDKPDIGPVEDENQASVIPAPVPPIPPTVRMLDPRPVLVLDIEFISQAEPSARAHQV